MQIKTEIFGVIGQGFVGGSLRAGFEEITDIIVETYDIAKPNVSTCKTSKELFEKSDIIFICVPTPMKKSGKCDTRIVEGVLDQIHNYSLENNVHKIAVVKSTIPPGSTAMWNDKFGRSKFRVVFNPEFLTEANAKEDFLNQNRIILGGPVKQVEYVKQIYNRFTSRQDENVSCNIITTSSTTAEFVKYVTNCYLAMKVSFSNEIYQIANAMGVDYNELMDTTAIDSRISRRHTQVPGPDGNLGWGGHCFPKDLKALIYVANNLGVDPIMLQATWDKNEAVRPEHTRDWEHMIGRAISQD